MGPSKGNPFEIFRPGRSSDFGPAGTALARGGWAGRRDGGDAMHTALTFAAEFAVAYAKPHGVRSAVRVGGRQKLALKAIQVRTPDPRKGMTACS